MKKIFNDRITPVMENDQILSAVYCDISSIVNRLNNIYEEKKIHINENTKKCITCGKIKPNSNFIEVSGQICTTRCTECRDIMSAFWMLTSKVKDFLNKETGFIDNERNKIISKIIIQPEHIKLRAILIQLNRKIKNYDAGKQ